MDKKERQEYFKKLHKKLALQFHLLPDEVLVIRHYSKFKNMNRREIAFHCAKKLQRPLGSTRQRRNKNIMNFVATCKQDDFITITQ